MNPFCIKSHPLQISPSEVSRTLHLSTCSSQVLTRHASPHVVSQSQAYIAKADQC